ncbi:MAG: hypothetical protein ACR2JO_14300 [Mycobacteriales bacterium]
MGLWRSRKRELSFPCEVCGADAGQRALFAEIYDPNRFVASRSSALGRLLNGKRIVQACSPEHLHELKRRPIEPEDWLRRA